MNNDRLAALFAAIHALTEAHKAGHKFDRELDQLAKLIIQEIMTPAVVSEAAPVESSEGEAL